MSAAGKWGDLQARMGSAAAMILAGTLALWLGGLWFQLLIALVCGGMMWELTRMMAADTPQVARQMGVLAALAQLMAAWVPGILVAPLLLAVPIVGMRDVARDRWLYALYAAALMLACYSILVLRDGQGVLPVIWLVLVVVATDVAGYFAGRSFGGPKFWPRVSPKKTWSGTAAGWLAAAIVGLLFGGFGLMAFSVLAAFASQLGDIAESALKRRAGIKDSSALIPGHGGLLDRFDGMMAAALFVVIFAQLLGVPVAQL